MTGLKKRDLRSRKEWIEMFPYGMAVSPDNSRPVMIFKDKAEQNVLPVWLNHLEAGIAVQQSGAAKTDSSPHNLTWKILGPLDVKLEKCFFTEVKGHYQFVKLQFTGSEHLKRVESRADEAISFCLSSNCRFYCQLEFIEKCRVLDGEMALALSPANESGDHHPYLN